MLSSGSVLQQRDFLLHPQHFPLAQHNLISTPRQSQHLQITFLQTNIWTHRQNPQGALTPSHVGTEFIQPQEERPVLGRGLGAHVSVTGEEEFFTEEIETSRDLLVPPLGRDSVCHLQQKRG